MSAAVLLRTCITHSIVTGPGWMLDLSRGDDYSTASSLLVLVCGCMGDRPPLLAPASRLMLCPGRSLNPCSTLGPSPGTNGNVPFWEPPNGFTFPGPVVPLVPLRRPRTFQGGRGNFWFPAGAGPWFGSFRRGEFKGPRELGTLFRKVPRESVLGPIFPFPNRRFSRGCSFGWTL